MSSSIQSHTPNFKQTLAIPTEPVWRFSISQYHSMISLGILTEAVKIGGSEIGRLTVQELFP